MNDYEKRIVVFLLKSLVDSIENGKGNGGYSVITGGICSTIHSTAEQSEKCSTCSKVRDDIALKEKRRKQNFTEALVIDRLLEICQNK